MCLLYDLFKAQYSMFVVTSTGSISQVGLDGRKAADTGLSRARGPRNQIKKEFVKFSIELMKNRCIQGDFVLRLERIHQIFYEMDEK